MSAELRLPDDPDVNQMMAVFDKLERNTATAKDEMAMAVVSLVERAQNIIWDRTEEIKTSRAQVEQLERWIAAVPVEALKRQYTIGFHLYQSWLVDQDAILAWLRSLEPQP